MNQLLHPPLTVLEEFLLLCHDNKTNQFYPFVRSTFDCATAGAVLMDLTLRHRIDNDLRHIFVVDPEPINDDLLDPVLQTMCLAPVLEPKPITYWLQHIADEGEALRERALRRLEANGILKREEKKIFWALTTECYPILHAQDVREVRQRLKDVILKDHIPLPHDVMLTALAQASGLFRYLLDGQALNTAQKRIDQVTKLDLIGQAVAKAVSEIETAMAMVPGFR